MNLAQDQLMGNAVRGPDDTMRVIETILACLDGSRRHCALKVAGDFQT